MAELRQLVAMVEMKLAFFWSLRNLDRGGVEAVATKVDAHAVSTLALAALRKNTPATAARQEAEGSMKEASSE